MKIVAYVHVDRIVNPTGVGRVIDQLIKHHKQVFPDNDWSILADKTVYRRCLPQLDSFWQSVHAIPIGAHRSLRQMLWILFNVSWLLPRDTQADILYCPAEAFVPKGKAKLVCTIHDVAGFESELYSRWSSLSYRLKWSLMFLRFALTADAIITVSAFSKARICHFFPFLEKKIHVVHNAAAPIFSQPLECKEKQRIFELVRTQNYVFLPGGLSLRKNARLVLDAWPKVLKSLRDVKLVVCGRTEEPYVSEVREQLKDSVLCLGYVSDTVMNGLYQCATVVWFPSKYEGFGMPALEAMVCGKPLVVSQVSSLPEVVGDAALLCSPLSPDGHASAIVRFFQSETLRQTYSMRAKTRARDFSWEHSAQQLDKVFKDCVAMRRSQGSK